MPKDVAALTGADLTAFTGVIRGILHDTSTRTATAVAGAATLNKLAGKITTESLTTAGANGSYVLTLTNNTIAATDIVLAACQFGTNSQGSPIIGRCVPGNGTVTIVMYNIGAQALNGTMVISFQVVKIT